MRTHLLFTLYHLKPKIRLINASAKGPVWEEHHSELKLNRIVYLVLFSFTYLSFLSSLTRVNVLLTASFLVISTKEERK